MRFLAAFLVWLLPALVLAQDPMQFAPFMMKSGIVTDWSTRVVANGGAMPSQNTINAMETLRVNLIALGITNKIHALCRFVPDSVIAASTPLFHHLGYGLWTNNFTSGDLTVNGLKGDGSSKAMDTGIRMQDFVPVDGSSGMSLIVTESASNAVNTTAGYMSAAGTVAFSLNISDSGVTRWRDGTFALEVNTVNTNDWGRVGWISGNRDDNDNLLLFVASPLESHKLLKVVSNAFQADFSTDANTVSIFASKRGTTNESGTFSAQRVSAALVHDAFTQEQASNVWWALKVCGEQLGGGTGDNVHDYNRKIVAFGGAAISTTSSNLLRVFRLGLDVDGNLYNMVCLNPFTHDNLTAARTPFLWQAGSEIWTNFNFVGGDITVAGLQGNGTTKYLGPGIVPSAVVQISDTSAGYTAIISVAPTTSDGQIYRSLPITASVDNGLDVLSARARFFMWRNDVVNGNFLSAPLPSPGGNWTGYLSGNRTAANAIALYMANSTTAHQVLTNGTGSQTGTKGANTRALVLYAANNNGTVSGWTDRTLSFWAMHQGLTQTQSSNLYVRVNTLMTSRGGGSP